MAFFKSRVFDKVVLCTAVPDCFFGLGSLPKLRFLYNGRISSSVQKTTSLYIEYQGHQKRSQGMVLMSKTLVVVESPAKAKTIKKYLGSEYDVRASVGHIKDLPSKAEKQAKTSRKISAGPVLGVDVERDFKPYYEIIPGKEKVIRELREAAAKSSRVLLATDPDREGEAIAFHLSDELSAPSGQIFRVRFHELTEKTIRESVANPTRLDENKYNAQQTRRILDRIVGYQISPLLWDKVQYGLSAGRVQSVALRLIVDRQYEIETFVPTEFWSIVSRLRSEDPPEFEAKLVEVAGKKAVIPDIVMARELFDKASKADFIVEKVLKKERSRKPSPPFITSTLQQEASKKLRLTSNRTMRIAQQLYEGIELGSEGSVGLITYMRTDSPRISPEFSEMARAYIQKTFGSQYVPKKPNVYQSKKSAQEAHEAIRPTSLDLTPDKVSRYLDKAQRDLYTLIWKRFLASQASAAVFDQTSVSIKCEDLLFRVNGSILKFDGFMKIYEVSQDTEESEDAEDKNDSDRRLPPMKVGQKLKLEKIVPRQSFTQPPPAFTEASLIKELEEQGIGRPSTYAETVSTIQRRKYVQFKEKKFRPTVLGRIIAGLLVDSFPKLVNPKFTAEMESLLDLIEEGEASWTDTLSGFYKPFQDSLNDAKSSMKSVKREGITSGEMCPECGDKLLIRVGRFGLFLGCNSYPECQYTRKIVEDEEEIKQPVNTDKLCECGAQMVIRESKSGPFLSCARYPECKNSSPLSTGLACPKCHQGELIERKTKRKRTFFSCSQYPKCDFSMWLKPLPIDCPNKDCDSNIMQRQLGKKQGAYLQCPKCGEKVLETETEGKVAG